MIGNHVNHCTNGPDTLLEAVKWDSIFDTVLFGFECRHCIFRNYLVKMFESRVGRGVELTVIKYHISCLMN